MSIRGRTFGVHFPAFPRQFRGVVNASSKAVHMRLNARQIRSLTPGATVTPPWLLFFMRELRASNGNYALAWRQLPRHLPRGVACPSVAECAAALAVHHLV